MTGGKEQKWILVDGCSNTSAALKRLMKTSARYTSAYNEVIPVKKIKVRHRQKHSCWWNEQVKSAKKSLNHFQRKFKKRNTVQNKLNLIAAEEEFKKAKEDAQESWRSLKAQETQKKYGVFTKK